MKLPMHGTQVLAVHVGVELGGGEVGVAQHLLDRPQVSSALEQVRGEAVAQRMRRDTLGEPRLLCGAPDEDRKSTRLNSSHVSISYAVFCLKKKSNIRHS